ncbi:hypothetical protein LX15_005683 [Streptoalloteichus tenebrarius]|uniref:Uncharacterized protein n=1 Tax=Streptoalloteichus tenebrarius (strain ATCC 17920 / DSM 40477 / JCM 4838 / CBS 697.72 / NBRC 16177 / NCIMB 11028 / NRRL B-12390 / A12253. 1 / ISP 5477) TaxID=1933 RepID=A0ABT1I2K8_STRSD|nr:DUF6493 family protein [Streptoalloteichus tenebrarius]MCP2261956.1 hypothetical protein [Streptoalloteichus tenebrarius]BFF01257.1 hypothetical protein GCM10020241_29320 [Streptoalloteichus tenebrarius]
MSAVVDDLRDLVERGDATGVARLVGSLGPSERRVAARWLPTFLRDLRQRSSRGRLESHHQMPLWLAGAGCLGGAAATARWLAHRDLVRHWVPEGRHVAELSQILERRSRAWLVDVATRYAAGFRLRRHTWAVASALLRLGGVEPPGHDLLVVAWCAELERAGRDELRTDAFLSVMAPRVFRSEGVGAALAGDAAGHARRFARLVDEGLLPRRSALTGCLGRFLRGGEARAMRFFTLLYRELAPTVDEAADHVVSFLRLLPSASEPVAELAAQELRRACDAGWLSGPELRETFEALLFRQERKIVHNALSWLDRAAGRPDGDEVLAALPVAFGRRDHEVARHGVRIAARHARRAGEHVRVQLATAAMALPRELRETLARSGLPTVRVGKPSLGGEECVEAGDRGAVRATN